MFAYFRRETKSERSLIIVSHTIRDQPEAGFEPKSIWNETLCSSPPPQVVLHNNWEKTEKVKKSNV